MLAPQSALLRLIVPAQILHGWCVVNLYKEREGLTLFTSANFFTPITPLLFWTKPFKGTKMSLN